MEKKTSPAGADMPLPNDTARDPGQAPDTTLDQLSPGHLATLREESSISDEVIQARGYRTITDPKHLAQLGFPPAQRRVPGLLLPLWTTDGQNPFCVCRPDDPRVVEEKRKSKLPDGTYPCKVIKYEVPKGIGTRLDCPPLCHTMLADPSVPLWITEGQKKADALASRGLCAIALLGVWNWKGANSFGGTTLLADFDYIALNGRDVRLVFDSDVVTKSSVRQALDRLIEHLQRKGAHVSAAYLPSDGAGKIGVDDWLAAGHTIQELEACLDGPRPQLQPAACQVQLLDAPPAAITRPLTLVDGRAYAATWLHARTTQTEGLDKSGNLIKYAPPIVRDAKELFVIREDGCIFGPGGDQSLQELGLEVRLPEIPPSSSLWSTGGVKAYARGERPDPADVFCRIIDIVDRFIDFGSSLADQRTMCELIACYVLATWFLDAFTVIGYLWPSGDRGSGKTQLLAVVCQLAYLGIVILAGGSYATLRDLADYGATLAFDDAENLSDPRRSDPDKRALLLAGNRRGSLVTVKEPQSDRTWRTRYVNAFCPRLFSATQLPDNILASRSIVVPLVRTVDHDRANTDALDYDEWPHDRRELTDDLWALGLAHLSEMHRHEKLAAKKARLTGRSLEPWRPILTVALWLDELGVDGLWDRMEELSVQYQDERAGLETGDLASLVIRAMCQCASSATCASQEVIPEFVFTVEQIYGAAQNIAKVEYYDVDGLTVQKIGRMMSQLRIETVPRPGGTGSRMRKFTADELERLATSYNIPLPESLSAAGTAGTSGTVAQDNEPWEVEL